MKKIIRTLVIFYSYEGNTRLVAQIIAQQLGADMLELIPEKQPHTKGFLKYFWGGKQVLTRARPQLQKFGKNPKKYDRLIIGTPVWIGNFAPALRSFFAHTKLKNQQIALFCTHEGRPVNALQNMTKELEGNTIISQTNFLRPSLNKRRLPAQVSTWLKNFK